MFHITINFVVFLKKIQFYFEKQIFLFTFVEIFQITCAYDTIRNGNPP